MKTAIAAWLISALAHWTAIPTVCGAKTPDPCDTFVRTHFEPVESFQQRIGRFSELLADVTDTPAHALDLAAIGFEESAYLRPVDDGTCNTRTGLAHGVGWNCDGGKAYTVFQIRPDLMWRPKVSGADLLADPKLAVSTAWTIYQRSPAQWATWPRARALASAWTAAHPAPAP